MNINFLVAQVFGMFALIILIFSFQKNSKRSLLEYQMLSSLLYGIQYFFLDAYTGLLMNLVCLVRNYIFYKYSNGVPIYWLIFIIIIMIYLSVIVFSGVISLLPMIAVVIYSIAVWYGKLKIIRIGEVISALLFIIYNIKVMAITGLIATFIELFAVLIAIYRYDLRKFNSDS